MNAPELAGWSFRKKNLPGGGSVMTHQMYAIPVERTLTTFTTNERRAAKGWKSGKLMEITYEAVLTNVLISWSWNVTDEKWWWSARANLQLLKPRRDLDDLGDFYGSGWRAGDIGQSWFERENPVLPDYMLELVEATLPHTRIIFQEVPENAAVDVNITTDEQLLALSSEGLVLRDSAHNILQLWEIVDDEQRWYTPRDDGYWLFDKIVLPAKIIFMPEEKS